MEQLGVEKVFIDKCSGKNAEWVKGMQEAILDEEDC